METKSDSKSDLTEPFIHKDEKTNLQTSITIDEQLSNNEYKPSPLAFKNIKSSIKQTRTNILDKIVLPNYYQDIESIMDARSLYRLSSNYTELFSKILSGASTVVAFAAGAYPDYTYLSFVSGCIGTVAIVCQQISTYFNKQESERTEQANKILNIFGIGSIPDLDNEQQN